MFIEPTGSLFIAVSVLAGSVFHYWFCVTLLSLCVVTGSMFRCWFYVSLLGLCVLAGSMCQLCHCWVYVSLLVLCVLAGSLLFTRLLSFVWLVLSLLGLLDLFYSFSVTACTKIHNYNNTEKQEEGNKRTTRATNYVPLGLIS